MQPSPRLPFPPPAPRPLGLSLLFVLRELTQRTASGKELRSDRGFHLLLFRWPVGMDDEGIRLLLSLRRVGRWER